MIVRLNDPVPLVGQLAGQRLYEVRLRPPSARYLPAMVAMRMDGTFSDDDILNIAARLSGRGRAILARMSDHDRAAVRAAVEQEYTAAARRLGVRSKILEMRA